MSSTRFVETLIRLLRRDSAVETDAGESREIRTSARDRLMDLVVKDTPAVRREAATALGRIKNGAAVPALFEGLRSGGDRYLEHALIYALIEIADRQAILKGLSDRSPQVRRGALIALDRMEKGNLTQELVTPLLDTDDPPLQKTALAVLTSRGWAKEIIGLLRQWLAEKDVPAERQESLRGCILALAKDQAIQQVVAQTLERPETSTATRSLLLETIARAPLDQLPDGWSAELGRALDHAEEPVVRQAVAAIRARRVTQFDAKLFHLAQEQNNTADLRVAALAGTVSRLPQVEP